MRDFIEQDNLYIEYSRSGAIISCDYDYDAYGYGEGMLQYILEESNAQNSKAYRELGFRLCTI